MPKYSLIYQLNAEFIIGGEIRKVKTYTGQGKELIYILF
jgi:hypothetical protein